MRFIKDNFVYTIKMGSARISGAPAVQKVNTMIFSSVLRQSNSLMIMI